MSNIIAYLVGAILGEVLIVLAFTKMLNMKNSRLFVILYALYIFIMLFIRETVSIPVRMVLVLASFGVLPFVLSQGRVSRRLFIIFLINIVVLAAECLALTVWAWVSGNTVVSYAALREDYFSILLVHLVHFVALGILFLGLRVLLNEYFKNEAERTAWLYMVIPLTQAFLLCILNAIGLAYPADSSALFAGGSVLSIFCILSSISLFISIDRYEKKQAKDQHAGLLQQQLDQYLFTYSKVVSEIERTVCFRHDLCNQMQVISVLADQGNIIKAQLYTRLITEEFSVGVKGETRR